MPSEDLVKILQVSVMPVVLISGIGLLLLSMTNRLGRVVDRVRLLGKETRTVPEEDQRKIRRQLRLLSSRARLLRTAIVASTVSILFVAVTILTLFADFLLPIPMTGLVLIVFAASIGALIVSLVFFLKDLTLSLKALWMELNDRV